MVTKPYMVDRTCEKCGEVFTRYRSQKPKFCSWKCALDSTSFTAPRLDLLGKRFGRLLVVSFRESRRRLSGKGTYAIWNCVCDCGKPHPVHSMSLVTGATKSCGCIQREDNARRRAERREREESRVATRRTQDAALRARRQDPLVRKATSLWAGARKRSKAQGLICTVTAEEVETRLRETRGICPTTPHLRSFMPCRRIFAPTSHLANKRLKWT